MRYTAQQQKDQLKQRLTKLIELNEITTDQAELLYNEGSLMIQDVDNLVKYAKNYIENKQRDSLEDLFDEIKTIKKWESDIYSTMEKALLIAYINSEVYEAPRNEDGIVLYIWDKHTYKTIEDAKFSLFCFLLEQDNQTTWEYDKTNGDISLCLDKFLSEEYIYAANCGYSKELEDAICHFTDFLDEHELNISEQCSINPLEIARVSYYGYTIHPTHLEVFQNYRLIDRISSLAATLISGVSSPDPDYTRGLLHDYIDEFNQIYR